MPSPSALSFWQWGGVTAGPGRLVKDIRLASGITSSAETALIVMMANMNIAARGLATEDSVQLEWQDMLKSQHHLQSLPNKLVTQP